METRKRENEKTRKTQTSSKIIQNDNDNGNADGGPALCWQTSSSRIIKVDTVTLVQHICCTQHLMVDTFAAGWVNACATTPFIRVQFQIRQARSCRSTRRVRGAAATEYTHKEWIYSWLANTVHYEMELVYHMILLFKPMCVLSLPSATRKQSMFFSKTVQNVPQQQQWVGHTVSGDGPLVGLV